MTKENESRRAFLVGSAAIGAAALVPESGSAAETAHQDGAPVQMLPDGVRHGAFFNDEDAATVEAFAERLMPGAPGKPGAREAGVLNYIDLALAGAYRDRQEFYRHGLAALARYCRATYGKGFAQLSAEDQDKVIFALEAGHAAEFTWPSAKAFFETLRIHTIEGMFADPVYGGNRDFSGWRLVGFPGVQMSFTPADLDSRAAFTREPIAGLQARAIRRRRT